MLGAGKKLIKIAAVAVALTGFGFVTAPRQAEAAPLAVPVEATAPTDGTVSTVQYRHRHWHHRRHFHRHHWRHGPRHFHRHHHRGRWGHHHHRRHHWR